MLARIPAERIMQKNKKVLANALTVENLASPIVFALIAVFMMDTLWFMEKTNNNLFPTIGIDLMGSDEDSQTVLSSLIPTLEKNKQFAHFVLFGEEKNKFLLQSLPFISYKIASDQIGMDENPLIAVRRKKNSSIHLGILALKNKEIDAFISKGNTGALMATARAHLKTLPSITRPALLTLLPTKRNEIAILDVGANTTCKSSHLAEFAAMGVAYQKARGIDQPKIGLLNIGIEPIKGTPELRDAYKTLSKLNDHHEYPVFSGNVEARDVFEGEVDVLITDGFTGNIFLKTAEGIARFLLEQLKDNPAFPHLQSKLDYSEYPGALLSGVRGIVIKCHGSSKSEAFHHSIRSAVQLLKQNFLYRGQIL